MKKILLTITAICLSWTLFGQSTAVSKTDSTTEIREFVKNSQSILDSLTKFHFAKLELSEVRKKRDEWQSNYFTLNAQAVGCKNDFVEEKKVSAGLRVEIADLKTEIIIKSQKLFKSNLEKWAWRIGSVLGSYFLLK